MGEYEHRIREAPMAGKTVAAVVDPRPGVDEQEEE